MKQTKFRPHWLLDTNENDKIYDENKQLKCTITMFNNKVIGIETLNPYFNSKNPIQNMFIIEEKNECT